MVRLVAVNSENAAEDSLNELLDKVNTVFREENALISDVLNVCMFLATVAAVDHMTKERFLEATAHSWDVVAADEMEVH